jgi:hypothetical protein
MISKAYVRSRNKFIEMRKMKTPKANVGEADSESSCREMKLKLNST